MSGTRHNLIDLIYEYSPNSLPETAIENAACKCLLRHGVDWLTDEQLQGMADRLVADWEFSEKLNAENRARAAAKGALS